MKKIIAGLVVLQESLISKKDIDREELKITLFLDGNIILAHGSTSIFFHFDPDSLKYLIKKGKLWIGEFDLNNTIEFASGMILFSNDDAKKYYNQIEEADQKFWMLTKEGEIITQYKQALKASGKDFSFSDFINSI